MQPPPPPPRHASDASWERGCLIYNPEAAGWQKSAQYLRRQNCRHGVASMGPCCTKPVL